MLTLTNSLTKQLDSLDKKPGDAVTVYSCGPTVYNHAHIGNLRSFIMDDLLRRTIIAAGYKLNAIMNITDIDDKTIHKSIEEYPELAKTDPKAALKKSSEKYEELFFDDLKAVGVDTSLFKVVRATEQIPEMQALITQIHANGFAYISEGSIYFDVAKYIAAGNTYGLLAHIDTSHQVSRIDNDEYEKHEAQDFVLWKVERDNEPAWDFELNGQNLPGRPGWHIECSAMSAALGQPFDIHTGGIDLKFPHHENEIAQTKAASDKQLAKIFVHWNHLLVDGKKMSKSAHNFYILSDLTGKDYSPLTFRLLCLQAHYSSELNFTWASLRAAQNRLLSLYSEAVLHYQMKPSSSQLPASYLNALEADLATPMLLSLHDGNGVDKGFAPPLSYTRWFDDILGLDLTIQADIEDDPKQLIAKREAARKANDFTQSDKVRAELLKQGIAIDDTPAGPRWRRTKI